ncbi:hypothetical protein Sjap_016415 [Stephania japonica]|uniref:Uncharacterized protein n=1 Tax=Stephania japonica TaxID=461633 RepID=A0AAP0IM47_9MAGN
MDGPNPRTPITSPQCLQLQSSSAAASCPQRQPAFHRSIGNRVGVYDPRLSNSDSRSHQEVPVVEAKWGHLKEACGVGEEQGDGSGEGEGGEEEAALGGEDVGVGVGVGIGGVGVWRWWDERRGGWCSHFSAFGF